MSKRSLVIPQGGHFSKPGGQFSFWWLVLHPDGPGPLCPPFTSPYFQKTFIRMALLVRTRGYLNPYLITASCQHPKRKAFTIVVYKYFPSNSLKNKDFTDPEGMNVFNDCHGFFWEFCSVAIWTPWSSKVAMCLPSVYVGRNRPRTFFNDEHTTI